MEKLRLQSLDDQVRAALQRARLPRSVRGRRSASADVVYIDHTSWLQTLFLFMPGGRRSRVSPVTSADGLVGRVILAEGSYAKVQLVTDRASGVGAMIERTRRQGIVRGAGRDGLTLEYVPLQADVQVGRPRALLRHRRPLPARRPDRHRGRRSSRGGELFHSIRLAPAVDFGSSIRSSCCWRTASPAASRGARVRVLRFVAALVAALLAPPGAGGAGAAVGARARSLPARGRLSGDDLATRRRRGAGRGDRSRPRRAERRPLRTAGLRRHPGRLRDGAHGAAGRPAQELLRRALLRLRRPAPAARSLQGLLLLLTQQPERSLRSISVLRVALAGPAGALLVAGMRARWARPSAAWRARRRAEIFLE